MNGQRSGVTCASVADALPGIVDGLAVADLELRRHVETCLRCQAELAQYRKLLKALHALRTEMLEPAPGMLPDILASLGAAGERRAMRHLLSGRRAAYVGGIAAATAAGAAGAIVLASRHRRHRLRLASWPEVV
jgi:anti-sigma factor RsiW